jgi:hypothetical protein
MQGLLRLLHLLSDAARATKAAAGALPLAGHEHN